MTATTRSNTFLAIAILGLVGQLALFGAFLADEGLDFAEMGDQMFESTMAAVALADLAGCFVAYLVWMPREAARVGLTRWWPYAVASLGGLCFAFPLFLAARERHRSAAAT
jgi:hypothetical protein